MENGLRCVHSKHANPIRILWYPDFSRESLIVATTMRRGALGGGVGDLLVVSYEANDSSCVASPMWADSSLWEAPSRNLAGRIVLRDGLVESIWVYSSIRT